MTRINLSVGQRVTLGFVVMILLVVLSSGVGLFYSRSAKAALDASHNNSTQIDNVRSLQLQWASVVTLVDKLLLSRQTSIIDQQLNQDIAVFNQKLDALQEQTIGQSPESIAENREIVKDLKQLGADLTKIANQISKYAQEGSWARAQTLRFTEMTSLQRRLNDNLDQLNNNVASDIDSEVTNSNANQNLANTQLTIILIFALIMSTVLAYFTTRSITTPVSQLLGSVQKIMNRDFSHQEILQRNDEFGKLSQATSLMTNLLKETYEQLEQRVADRTKALATSTEVSRRLSTILDRKELVAEVVNQVKNAFGYYHTQIYFYDEARENLVMAGGTGEAGRRLLEQFHKLANGRGLVGRAAENNEPILVADTAQNPEWLPNPLLPETKSEVAIPISIGDLVLGVLDVQHNIVDGLKREDIDALQSISNQVAVAVQNARSYSKTWEAQQLTRNVINSTDDWIFIKDQDHRYQLVNQGYANSLHIPIADFIGKNDLELGFPEELVKGNPEKGIPGFWADDRSVMDGGVSKQIPDDLVSIDGNIHVFDTVKVPLRDADNKVWGVLAFARDMTERRNLEELNRKRAVQQEALNLITQKIQSTTSIEAALQMAARELGHAMGMKPTLVMLESKAVSDKNHMELKNKMGGG